MRPHWRGTLLYPASLVALFLGLQGLLGLMGVPASQQASLAALPSVAALLISLPWRLQRAWGEPQAWKRLGLRCSWGELIKALSRGVLLAAALLLVIVVALLLGGAQSELRLTPALVLNAVVLGLGVGFAEELLFRGWLFGELSLLLGHRRALYLQAVIFSLVHTRFHLPGLELLLLLGGLALFGVLLAEQRDGDRGVLWGAVGLHGGAVGGWFLLSQGVLNLQSAGPNWLLSPANPIGGVAGWIALMVLLLTLKRS
ncbi:CPBP family intramembrane glutamic endopeptidase [Synechococcus sp. MIT S9452]|uniref:CPBP family intramembrane glutamic endopeptidase n=1 Tax=Synechococcus sp. MIT S9452 TaxID=3082546 RepID=UPI0039A77164